MSINSLEECVEVLKIVQSQLRINRNLCDKLHEEADAIEKTRTKLEKSLQTLLNRESWLLDLKKTLSENRDVSDQTISEEHNLMGVSASAEDPEAMNEEQYAQDQTAQIVTFNTKVTELVNKSMELRGQKDVPSELRDYLSNFNTVISGYLTRELKSCDIPGFSKATPLEIASSTHVAVKSPKRPVEGNHSPHLEDVASKLTKWNVPDTLREFMSRLFGNFPGKDTIKSFENSETVDVASFHEQLSSTNAVQVIANPSDRVVYLDRFFLTIVTQCLLSSHDLGETRYKLFRDRRVKEFLCGKAEDNVYLDVVMTTLTELRKFYSCSKKQLKRLSVNKPVKKMLLELSSTSTNIERLMPFVQWMFTLTACNDDVCKLMEDYTPYRNAYTAFIKRGLPKSTKS